jgi:hypothetical protein
MDLDETGNVIREDLLIRCDPSKKIITGEASANTFAQVPPERLRRAFPHARLILCLRHPVDRAFSHYRMLQRFSKEGRRIPFRPVNFLSDFNDDMARVQNGGNGYFAGLSFYSRRLKAWSKAFGTERIFIVRTEDLYERVHALQILTELCHFLGIEDFDFQDVLDVMVNVAEAEEQLDPEARSSLFSYYLSDVQDLEAFTGRKFCWNP